MLKNFLLLAFLLTGLTTVVQKTVFSYQTDVAKSTKNSICESIVVPDERTGKTTIILKSNDNVEYLLIKLTVSEYFS